MCVSTCQGVREMCSFYPEHTKTFRENRISRNSSCSPRVKRGQLPHPAQCEQTTAVSQHAHRWA